MRRANAILTAAISGLFLVHLIGGSLELAGLVKGGSAVYSFLSRLMVVLTAVHAVIGIKLTADTIRISRKAGVSYFKENRLFWTRRISGAALILFMVIHVVIFLGRHKEGVYLLRYFGAFELATQILMVAALLIHLLTNIRPLKIAFGLTDKGNVQTDILFVLAVLLLLAGAAFVIYFIRWQVI